MNCTSTDDIQVTITIRPTPYSKDRENKQTVGITVVLNKHQLGQLPNGQWHGAVCGMVLDAFTEAFDIYINPKTPDSY